MPELNPIPAQYAGINLRDNLQTNNPAGHMHNDPTGVISGVPTPSTIGMQSPVGQAYMIRKALKESVKHRKFAKLSGHINVPKHSGRRVIANVDIPLLDDRNLNDQGIDARGVQIRNGNMYGSSRDIGRITSAIPALTELGGRVNRVGFSRTMIEGTFHHFGFFYEWTRDFEDFDSDPNVLSDMYRKAVEAAEQIQDDMIQMDLLHGAGTIVYSGTAFKDDMLDDTGEVDYAAIMRLQSALTDVGTPKQTTLLTGSNRIDTRTTSYSRYAFIPPELETTIKNMVDPHGNAAFIPVYQYGADSKAHVMEGEIGIIGTLKFVVHDSMLHWAGAGAAGAKPNFYQENGKYNVYPILVVGEGAYTTIGFQSSGQSKLHIKTVTPDQNYTQQDPYGKMGFTSIQWWYGILFEKPERIGLIKTVARI